MKPPRLRVLVLLSLALAAARFSGQDCDARPDGPPAAKLRILNLDPGTEVVRHPVVLIEGDGAAGPTLRAVNRSSRLETREMDGRVREGKWKALVELIPGANEIEVESGGSKASASIRYDPATSPYIVRVVYATDRSGDLRYDAPDPAAPQDYEGRLSTTAKLLQCFVAEGMRAQGFGRRTFPLEVESDGRVRVHVLRGSKSADEYRGTGDQQLFAELHARLAEEFPDGHGKNLTVMAYTRFDRVAKKPRAHTALGGGDLGLFGGAAMFAWPARLQDAFAALEDTTPVDGRISHDDSAGRGTRGMLTSTTLGAMVHELGHAFGLPHSTDASDVMCGRTMDAFHRAFLMADPPTAHQREWRQFEPAGIPSYGRVSSPRLAFTRHFRADAIPAWEGASPKMEMDESAGRIVVTSELGLRAIGIDKTDASGVLAVSTDAFPAAAPRRLEYSLDDLRRRTDSDTFSLVATDEHGNRSSISARRFASAESRLKSLRTSQSDSERGILVPGGPIRTRAVGGPGGAEFSEEGEFLVGIRYTVGDWSGIRVVTSVQAVFDGMQGRRFGSVHGTASGVTGETLAPEGYALAGLVVKSGAKLDGFEAVFFRRYVRALHATDVKFGGWCGARGGGAEVLLGGDGNAVVGIFGRSGTELDAVGLILR